MGSLLIVVGGALVLGLANLTARPVSAAPAERRGVPDHPTDPGGDRWGGSSLPPVEPGTLDEAEVDALVEAINDEYKALATYQKVVDTFGTVQPFDSIIRAEQQHIAALERLFVRYGVEIPTDEWYGGVPEFDSVTEACQAGVEAEIDNAALYDHLFAPVDEADIIQVFTRLRDASRYNHCQPMKRAAGSSPSNLQGCKVGSPVLKNRASLMPAPGCIALAQWAIDVNRYESKPYLPSFPRHS